MANLTEQLEKSIAAAEGKGVAETRAEKTTAITTARETVRADALAAAETEKQRFLSQFTELDWRKLPPPATAALLMKKPFKAKDMDYYLQPWQALAFAIFCFEQGVSPFTNEAWWNPQNNTANLTTEGKKRVARNNGYNLGPPRFEQTTREWPKGKPMMALFPNDIGITCRMDVNQRGDSSYTAWLSEWYMDRSPVWREKPLHMLQVRAYEKCISFASGSGISELPGDNDISVDDLPPGPTITVAGGEYQPPTLPKGGEEK